MKYLDTLIMSVLFLGIAFPLYAAQVDYFIKLPDIPGEDAENEEAVPALKLEVPRLIKPQNSVVLPEEVKVSPDEGSPNNGDVGIMLNTKSEPVSNTGDKHKQEIDIESVAPEANNRNVPKDDGVVVLYLVSETAPDATGADKILTKLEILDAAKKGNVEYTWKVEEGESIGEDTKDIVLKGSKIRENLGVSSTQEIQIRGWDPKKKEEVLKPENVQTDEDLEAFVITRVLEDSAIEEIALNYEKIKLSYVGKGKLLGILPIGITQEVEIDTSDTDNKGRVQVRFPWWGVLVKKNVSSEEIKKEIEMESEKRKLQFEIQNLDQKMSQYFDMLSNIMKTKHDTANGVVQNIK